jgi:hypothetical protein
VIGGEVRADLASGSATSKGGCRRSGLGITADGALIYAVGSYLHLYDLARALKHAGAVRAMQLDIHTQWLAFNVFQPTSRRGPELSATKLIASMRHPSQRYLEPDDRDFVAVFIR